MQQFKLFSSAKKKVDLVVDLSNLVHRSYHRFKDFKDESGKLTGHVYGSFSMLMSLVKHTAANDDWRLVIAAEYGKCAWRQELYPDYKKGREKDPAKAGIIKEVEDILSTVPCLVLSSDGYEADDVVATHVTQESTRTHFVLSSDKDLWQLIDLNCSILRSTTEKPVSSFDVAEEFLTDNHKFVPLAKSLMGDTSDKIAGVRMFSRKDAQLLFQHLQQPTYEDLLSVATEHQAELLPRTLKSIVNNEQLIRDLLKLTTLERKCTLVTKANVGNEETFKAQMMRYNCSTLADRSSELFRKA